MSQSSWNDVFGDSSDDDVSMEEETNEEERTIGKGMDMSMGSIDEKTKMSVRDSKTDSTSEGAAKPIAEKSSRETERNVVDLTTQSDETSTAWPALRSMQNKPSATEFVRPKRVRKKIQLKRKTRQTVEATPVPSTKRARRTVVLGKITPGANHIVCPNCRSVIKRELNACPVCRAVIQYENDASSKCVSSSTRARATKSSSRLDAPSTVSQTKTSMRSRRWDLRPDQPPQHASLSPSPVHPPHVRNTVGQVERSMEETSVRTLNKMIRDKINACGGKWCRLSVIGGDLVNATSPACRTVISNSGGLKEYIISQKTMFVVTSIDPNRDMSDRRTQHKQTSMRWVRLSGKPGKPPTTRSEQTVHDCLRKNFNKCCTENKWVDMGSMGGWISQLDVSSRAVIKKSGSFTKFLLAHPDRYVVQSRPQKMETIYWVGLKKVVEVDLIAMVHNCLRSQFEKVNNKWLGMGSIGGCLSSLDVSAQSVVRESGGMLKFIHAHPDRYEVCTQGRLTKCRLASRRVSRMKNVTAAATARNVAQPSDTSTTTDELPSPKKKTTAKERISSIMRGSPPKSPRRSPRFSTSRSSTTTTRTERSKVRQLQQHLSLSLADLKVNLPVSVLRDLHGLSVRAKGRVVKLAMTRVHVQYENGTIETIPKVDVKNRAFRLVRSNATDNVPTLTQRSATSTLTRPRVRTTTSSNNTSKSTIRRPRLRLSSKTSTIAKSSTDPPPSRRRPVTRSSSLKEHNSMPRPKATDESALTPRRSRRLNKGKRIVVLLDLDHTLIHMLRVSKFPIEAKMISELVFQFTTNDIEDLDEVLRDANLTNAVASRMFNKTDAYKVALRQGSTQLVRVLRDLGVDVRIVTANLFGKHIVRKLTESSPSVWGGLRTSVCFRRDRVDAVKSFALAGLPENAGEDSKIIILDDNKSVWEPALRKYVWQVRKFDLLKSFNKSELKKESEYLRRILGDIVREC